MLCVVYLIRWFVRWEVSGCFVEFCFFFGGGVCSKQCIASAYDSHLASSQSVSFDFKWCNYTVVPTRQQIGRIPVSFYQKSDFHRWSITSTLHRPYV